MPPAARLGDLTSHPGSLSGPGVGNVRINGLPAIVQGDLHSCSFPPPPAHPPTPVVFGSGSVRIGGRPAARIGDSVGCGAVIVAGSPNVRIGG